MNIPPIEKFTAVAHFLPAVGTWRKSVHLFDDRSAQAIRAALASGRPLLVRGEPGTGKSQLARAAAKVLGRRFLSQVVDAHTEIQDLWYSFDAVSRLGNAQVMSVQPKGVDVEAELAPQKYLSPGILWWTFSWGTAVTHKCKHPLFVPEESEREQEDTAVVLLLDEIDKADADLPNSLLETLDNGKFTVPWINKLVGVDDESDIPRPFVVITTNEDRQLPAAFIRRCMVLDLTLPDSEADLTRILKQRAAFHFPEKQSHDRDQPITRDEENRIVCRSRFTDSVLQEAAAQLYQDRLQADSLGVSPPGQAEYLDMLQVLDELTPNDPRRQLQLLKDIKEFVLKKYPGMQRHNEDDNVQGGDSFQENEAEEWPAEK